MLSFRVTTIVPLLLILVMGMSVFVSPVVAEPTATINYQGKLTDSSGIAVADGTYNMRFWLLDSGSVATTSAEWTESLTGGNKVQVTNGLFSVMLGSTTPLTSVDFNQALFLGVEIGGSGAITWDGEMSPRKPLGTVPAAFEAFKLGGVASSSFLRSDIADTAGGLLTFSGGLISSASSTIFGLNFGTATGTTLNINGESFTDFTGTGLTNTAGVLSVATSSLNISLEGLTDVSSMTKNFGDLLYWTGSAWADLATSSLNVALTDTTGTLGVTRGGTGITSISTGGLLYGSGADTISALGVGTTGQILQISAGVPAWTATSTLGINEDDTIITVAATDTPATEKAAADFIADGTDDEVQIQAAIDSLPSTGGTVQLLAGTFNVGTTDYATIAIRISATSTRLTGQGPSTVIKLQDNTTGTVAIIKVVSGSNVTIDNLKVDGNKANNTSGTHTGIGYDFGYFYSKLNQVIVDGVNGTGISFGTTYGVASNNISINNQGTGMGLAGPNNTLTNNTIRNNTGVGILAYFASNNIIDGNNLLNNIGGAITVAASGGNTFDANFIQNNGGGVNTSIFVNFASDSVFSDNFISATGTARLLTISAGSAGTGLFSNQYVNPNSTDFITDESATTKYNEGDRRTIATNNIKNFNLLSVTGSTTATATAITQLGTGDIFTLNNASGRALTVLNNGNVGIGSSSPNAKLSIRSTGVSGSGVIGINQYLQTTNSVLDATQIGNNYLWTVANTATSTIIGNQYEIKDDTTYDNTVAGITVSTIDGSNVKGLNVALLGTGKTFGLHGVTTGEANDVAEPAGGFFQTLGSTAGNAIRGYSDSITTSSLLSLFQDTSSFDGTGLEMSFGNAGGSFSSTASKYLDFQSGGTSFFTVSAYGTTTIGDGTEQAGLQIMNGGLCVDNGSGGGCSASSTGRISAIDYHTGNSDLAEMYFSSTDLESGELVVLSGGLSIDRANKDSSTPIIGVVSTKPGLTLGADDSSLVAGENAYPIALSGRVPVKLSTENGDIKQGDQLMLSSLPGIAMKATGTGAVVGVALEDFDSDRMYSDTFVNQFGDDMVDPVFAPILSNTDPRINDGCYYGGGFTSGGEPCVPLVATSTQEQIEEANTIIETESVEEALDELRDTDSETVRLENNKKVKVGQIVMFVDLSYRWVEDSQLASLGVLFGTSTTLDSARPDFFESDDKPLIVAIIDTMKEMWNKITQNFNKNQEQEQQIDNLNERVRQLEEALDIQVFDAGVTNTLPVEALDLGEDTSSSTPDIDPGTASSTDEESPEDPPEDKDIEEVEGEETGTLSTENNEADSREEEEPESAEEESPIEGSQPVDTPVEPSV